MRTSFTSSQIAQKQTFNIEEILSDVLSPQYKRHFRYGSIELFYRSGIRLCSDGSDEDIVQYYDLPFFSSHRFRGFSKYNESLTGFGISPDNYETAVKHAFFEYIERKVFFDQSYIARFSNLNTSFFNNKQNETMWVRNLSTGRSEQVPVLYFYRKGMASTEQTKNQIEFNSSGNAVGRNYQDACVRALCELLERDHVILSWLTKTKGVSITNLNESDKVSKVVNKFTRRGIEVSSYLLNWDFNVPVVVSVAFDSREKKFPIAAAGSAAHIDIETCISKSVIDTLVGLRSIHKFGPLSDSTSVEYLNHTNRIRYFTGVHAELLRDAFKGEASIPLRELIEQYESISEGDIFEYVVAQFSKVGDDYMPRVAQYKFPYGIVNLAAVRAWVPGLIPLYLKEKNKERHVCVNNRLKNMVQNGSSTDWWYQKLRNEPIPIG